MALLLKHDIRSSEVLDQIRIYDITGVYEPTDNTGGWGNNITNPLITNITEAYVNMYLPDGSQNINWNIFSSVQPFPNANNDPRYLKSSEIAAGYGNFPDGKYYTEYWVVGIFGGLDGILGLSKQTNFLYHNVLCCVKQAFAQIKITKAPCDNDLWKNARWGGGKIRDLEFLISCKKFEQAQVVLEELQDFCNTNKLNCGGC